MNSLVMEVLVRVAGTAPRVLQLFIFTVEPTMLSTRSPNLTSNSNYEQFELFESQAFPRCEYEMHFTTPAICRHPGASHDEL